MLNSGTEILTLSYIAISSKRMTWLPIRRDQSILYSKGDNEDNLQEEAGLGDTLCHVLAKT